MSRVLALVEGRTEQTFVRQVLAPHLGGRGVYLSARLVGKPGHKGGVGVYARARADILSILKQDTSVLCTTMFDYYAMPSSWPGRMDARNANVSSDDRARMVEVALADDVGTTLGDSFNRARFIPYLQMHEFEALLFSDVVELAGVIGAECANELGRIISEFPNPEDINDDAHTAPSQRILQLCATYRKVLHGSIIAGRIGLNVMRQRCSHFNQWLAGLEGLG